MVNKKWAGLVQPPEFRPQFRVPNGTRLDVASVYKTEEKGSDVNLGVHLVRDAALKQMDAAAILTNDTDLCEAVRIARKQFGMNVILLTPSPKPAQSLAQLCASVRHVKPYVGPCQFPNPVVDAKGSEIHKPADW